MIRGAADMAPVVSLCGLNGWLVSSSISNFDSCSTSATGGEPASATDIRGRLPAHGYDIQPERQDRSLLSVCRRLSFVSIV